MFVYYSTINCWKSDLNDGIPLNQFSFVCEVLQYCEHLRMRAAVLSAKHYASLYTAPASIKKFQAVTIHCIWISFNLLGVFKVANTETILRILFPFSLNSFCNAVLRPFVCSVDRCFHKHLLCCYKCFILQESCVIRQRKIISNYFKILLH